MRDVTSGRLRKIDERVGAQASASCSTRAMHFAPARLGKLIGHRERTRPLADIYPRRARRADRLWDLHHYMSEDILTKVDRATMRVSIEGREPLIDHRLVEFAMALPFRFKRGTLGAKHLLRKVLYRHVPRALVDRPKQGFGVPIWQWLRGDLSSLLDDYLSPGSVAAHGLLDPGLVQGYVGRFAAATLRSRRRSGCCSPSRCGSGAGCSAGMRILIVISGLGFGGAERQVVLVSRELVRRGHQVLIYTLNDACAAPARAVGQRCRTRGRPEALALRSVGDAAPAPHGEEWRADVVHSFLYDGDFYARMPAAA